MGFVATQGVYMPPPVALIGGVPSFNVTALNTLGNNKVAFIGKMWNPSRSAKNIRRVGFRFGTVTKAGGSGLTVSLQDVDTANGPVMRPDGTQDQTVAIASVDAGFATGLWYRTDPFSADRAVAFGELLAVVIEFDGAGPKGSDVIQISSFAGNNGAGYAAIDTQVVLFTASWATQNNMVNDIVLEFDDGTFGSLGFRCFPVSASTTANITSATTPDEIALCFKVPYACKIDGAFVAFRVTNATADFDIVLYDGTTPIASKSFDANAIASGSGNGIVFIDFSTEVTLTPGTKYFLAVKPTTTNSVAVYDVSVADANHFTVYPGGIDWYYAQRTDGGAWTETTTRRPLDWGIRISALPDSAGGGGLLVNPGMRGGMI